MNLMMAKYELSNYIERSLKKLKNSTSISDIVILPCEDIENNYINILNKLDNIKDKEYLDRMYFDYIEESTDLIREISRYHYLNDEMFKHLEDKETFDRLVYNLEDSIYTGYLSGFNLIINYSDDIPLKEYLEIWKRALRLIEVLPESALEFLKLNNPIGELSDNKELLKYYEFILKRLTDSKIPEFIEKEIKAIIKSLRAITNRKGRLPKELLEEFLDKKTGLSESERNRIIQDIEYLKKYPKTYFQFKRDLCYRDEKRCQKHRERTDRYILKELLNNKRSKFSDSEIEENFKKANENNYYLLVRGCSLIKRR